MADIKSAGYDNCEIFHPNGTTFLGYCDKSKLDWYLLKKIAEPLGDKSIKLLFEPKNISHNITTVKRENKCCGCESTNELRKFHVIPMEFKKLFPLKIKSHNSADIILLCMDCVADANYFSDQFKKECESKYNVSRFDFIDENKEKIKSTAIRYLKKKDNINLHPKAKEDLDKFMDILKKELAVDHSLNEEEIKELTTIDIYQKKDNTSTVAEFIVNKVLAEATLDEFIKDWKMNFIKEMKPEYIPEDFL